MRCAINVRVYVRYALACICVYAMYVCVYVCMGLCVFVLCVNWYTYMYNIMYFYYVCTSNVSAGEHYRISSNS